MFDTDTTEISDMDICPDKWLKKVKNLHRSPETTEWQNGKTHPELPGWYERYFTDGTFFQWWNCKEWCVGKALTPHWRQVGDYPAWRGLKPKVSNYGGKRVDD